MDYMKKGIVFVALATVMLLAGNTAKAQTRINFGFSNQLYLNEKGSVKDTSNTPGGFLGVNYNYAFWKGLGINIGLQGRFHFYQSDGSRDMMAAVDIPVLLNYRFELTEYFHITPMAGATLSVTPFGRTTVDQPQKEINWFAESGLNLNPFSVGFTVGIDLSFYEFHLYWHVNAVTMNINKTDGYKTIGGQNFIGFGYEFDY